MWHEPLALKTMGCGTPAPFAESLERATARSLPVVVVDERRRESGYVIAGMAAARSP
jgi:hypothetical protein